MNMLWFWIPVVLAISDEIHGRIVWKIGHDFYIILGGMIKKTVASALQTWLVHEIMEAVFHFIVLSLGFQSLQIGVLAALIHFILDIAHSALPYHIPPLAHRSLHFVIEALFFLAIYGW